MLDSSSSCDLVDQITVKLDIDLRNIPKSLVNDSDTDGGNGDSKKLPTLRQNYWDFLTNVSNYITHLQQKYHIQPVDQKQRQNRASKKVDKGKEKTDDHYINLGLTSARSPSQDTIYDGSLRRSPLNMKSLVKEFGLPPSKLVFPKESTSTTGTDLSIESASALYHQIEPEYKDNRRKNSISSMNSTQSLSEIFPQSVLETAPNFSQSFEAYGYDNEQEESDDGDCSSNDGSSVYS